MIRTDLAYRAAPTRRAWPFAPREPLKLDCLWTALCIVCAAGPLTAQQSAERARARGIVLDGISGPLDAITDVPGVTVGQVTLIRGSGRLVAGKGPVRTGVTTVFPRGRDNLSPVFAGWFSLNGNGEMTGTAYLDDYGLLFYPIAITNTNSAPCARPVRAAADAVNVAPAGLPGESS